MNWRSMYCPVFHHISFNRDPVQQSKKRDGPILSISVPLQAVPLYHSLEASS
jgi:hypothetical protein